MSSSIFLNNSFSVLFAKKIPLLLVSGRPPFLEMIVAQPLEAASIEVLPKGSFHKEGTVTIEDLLKILRVLM